MSDRTTSNRTTSNRTTRSAGLLAAAIALPIALIAGALVFFTFHDRVTANAAGAAAAKPSASATATGPVTMTAPTLTPAHATMCLAFVAQIGSAQITTGNATPKLRGLSERKVTAGPEQNVAFGDPPITAACGVAEPVVPPTAEIYPISGVCWYAQQNATDSVWTTLDRETPVAVTIPNSYSGAAQWAAEFTTSIVETLPRPTAKSPYNC